MGLRLKILSGFLILSAMLLVAGAWSVRQMSALGSSVQKVLDENYRSVHAAREMMTSLERGDSAILLLLLGKWEEGRSILDAADASFEENLAVATDNITIPGEREALDRIRGAYKAYKDLWVRPIVGTEHEGNLDWYTNRVNPAFREATKQVDELMSMNDRQMYQTASEVEGRANRAVMPGVVAILSALVFSLVFSYFVNYYMVGPLIRITQGVQGFANEQKPFDVRVETEDELGRLADAIHGLCARVRSSETKR